MTDLSLDFLLRMLTVAIFVSWWVYWRVTEKTADKEKPKTTNDYSQHRRNKIMRAVMNGMQLLLILQLFFGLHILPITQANLSLQLFGFSIVVIGFVVAVSARRTLGTNWAHAAEYQIKKKQELVTSGVYHNIRHPIYTSLVSVYLGGQFVAQSYLVVLTIVLIAGAYYQAKLEEKILTDHFGNAYKTYMKHSKMFIPYLW